MERLARHLTVIGEWDAQQQAAAENEAAEKVRQADKEAQSYGTLDNGPAHSPARMVDDVFKETSPDLRRQRQQVGY